MKLSDLKPGESALIQGYGQMAGFQIRLQELGLIRGTRVSLQRFSPLGDPMEICARGSRLSVRKKDADQIFVSRSPAA